MLYRSGLTACGLGDFFTDFLVDFFAVDFFATFFVVVFFVVGFADFAVDFLVEVFVAVFFATGFADFFVEVFADFLVEVFAARPTEAAFDPFSDCFLLVAISLIREIRGLFRFQIGPDLLLFQ